jgi:hypothetical protein
MANEKQEPEPFDQLQLLLAETQESLHSADPLRAATAAATARALLAEMLAAPAATPERSRLLAARDSARRSQRLASDLSRLAADSLVNLLQAAEGAAYDDNPNSARQGHAASLKQWRA